VFLDKLGWDKLEDAIADLKAIERDPLDGELGGKEVRKAVFGGKTEADELLDDARAILTGFAESLA
jgi:hypothetical protein